MKRETRRLILIATGLVFVSLACNLTSLAGGSASNVETAVAATVAVLSPLETSTPIPPATPEAHEVLPTATTSPTAAPIRISFVDSARNLYVWTDGTLAPVELVNSGDVVQSYISTDGNVIAYTRSADYTSYTLDAINTDGTNQRTLITAAAFAAMPRPSGSTGLVPYKLSWIPNRHSLGMSVRITFEGPGLQIGDTLYSVDADNGTVTTLLYAGENFNFSFSPDGSLLVITRPTGVDLYTAAGATILANVVSHEFVNTASEYAWVATPVWQNDSSNFMVVIPPKEPWVDTPGASAFWKVTSGGVATRVFSGQISFFPSGLASFNPTLTRMAFTQRLGIPTDNNWALHISNTDGSSDTVVDSGYFNQLPVWSPEGDRSVYAKKVGSANQAYLIVSGSSPVLLSDISSFIDARWLDGSRFVISSRGGSGSSLLMETVGGASGVIFNDPGISPQQEFSFDVNR